MDIRLLSNESADVIRAHADFVQEEVTEILELRLALHDELWVHTFNWFDEPHGVSLKTRQGTSVGKVLRPEQAAQIHSANQDAYEARRQGAR